jgi:hypothetical protein
MPDEISGMGKTLGNASLICKNTSEIIWTETILIDAICYLS